MHRRIFSWGLCVGLALASAKAQPAEVTKMALVTIDVQTELAASVAEVWMALTETATASRWYPAWSEAEDDAAALDAVGRTIRFTDEYGNHGRSVVVYVAPRAEIRFAHVPDDGAYLCQTSITLQAVGRKTQLHVREQYSDQLDVPVDRDTAATTRDRLLASLKSLRQLVE